MHGLFVYERYVRRATGVDLVLPRWHMGKFGDQSLRSLLYCQCALVAEDSFLVANNWVS